MSFLSCVPSVFVIGREYEILVNVEKNGILAVEVGGVLYYEENSGVYNSEKTYAKIRVPQSELDCAKGYGVIYRESVDRRSYASCFGETQREEFSFKPLEKKDNINLYHIADVHYRFDWAKEVASYFGEDLDVLLVNGDIGEVETEQNYFEVCRCVGEITRGELPVIFARGNHDTRGRLAERFTDIFPAEGKNTYYTWELGCLCGIVLDCGEDKPDANVEYGGANAFEPFRRRETAFLKSLSPDPDKLTFAMCHICPSHTTEHPGDIFDIERELYGQWNAELSRLGTRFMVCGHMHKAYLLPRHGEVSLVPHDFPIIVGSVHDDRAGELWGAALTVSGGKLLVRFTDRAHTVRGSHTIDLASGDVEA